MASANGPVGTQSLGARPGFLSRASLRLMGLRLLGASTRLLTPEAHAPPSKILIVRPDHLGDLLFTTPALRLLRESLPDSELVGLIGPWGEPILSRVDSLDRLIAWDFPWFNRKGAAQRAEAYRSAASLADLLRDEHFDAALILRYDHWWGALVAALAGIPVRIGYDRPENRPFLTKSLAYRSAPDDVTPHEVERNLSLARFLVSLTRPTDAVSDSALYPLEQRITDDERARLDAILFEKGVNPARPIVAIHAGAGATIKLWRAASFGRVGKRLADSFDASLLVTGGPGEAALANEIVTAAEGRGVSLAGQTGIGELLALFERSALVLGADSGPLHLAVAAGASTLTLFGPIDLKKFGPWGNPQKNVALVNPVPCHPCERLDECLSPLAPFPRACVLGIEEDEVFEQARTLLQDEARR